MNVILSVEALAPALSGIGRYTWELASRLPEHREVDEVRYFRNRQWCQDPAVLLEPPPPPSFSRWLARRLRPPLNLRKALVGWQCRGKLFHGPNYFLPSCADIGVATVHDLSVFRFPETHPVERVRHFEQEFTASMARATHLITDSAATRQEVIDFLAWPAEKITAVPLGVSTRFSPRADDDLRLALNKYGLQPGAYALCVSTLEPRKNIDKLLQAYQCLPPALRKRYPLVVVGGKGWRSDALHAEIERLAAQGWLHYLGFVPEADLPLLYAGARAFVYPSSYEGFGLPVLEAMASGIPVVTSNCSSLPEVTQGAALLVEPNDIDALTNCIARSLCDEMWRSTAIDLGLCTAGEYSWDRCVEQTVRVYQSVIC